jgi:chromate reductase, NAD(P)H dehydrogenase (quinone)
MRLEMKPRILALSGGSRRESLNARLLGIAVAGAQGAGAEVTAVQLADYELPLYESDWEAEHGLPEAARELQTLVAEHGGLLIATPEHNGGFTTLLKNTIDWIRRLDEYESAKRPAFPGKVAALVSASPGPPGRFRSQLALHMVLNKLGVIVLPTAFTLGGAYLTFDDEGHLSSEMLEAIARHVGATLVQVALLLASDCVHAAPIASNIGTDGLHALGISRNKSVSS